MALLLGLGMTLATGCSRGGEDRPDNRITVWSLESLPPRMATTKEIVARFERRTGIEVELVGVEEARLPQLIMSAAAAGRLPDVIGAVTLSQIWQMYGNDLLDTRAASRIVDGLGAGTFDANALALASDGDRRLAVPSDAWLQLLVYREDLLAQAGLPAPTSYRSLLTTAARLDRGDRYGIAAATDPGDVATQQSFESLALANGCQLVDDAGKVRLDTPACRTAFETYDALARGHGAPGTQNLDSTRATYFAGRSAMLLWSSFVLDELAGLRADALPSCPRCADDRAFLARRSGVVTAIRGPDGKAPAQFGEVTSWVITRDAETGASRAFVSHLMGAGYADWFGMAPEGKIPVREGTPGDPGSFLRAWRTGSIGVDTRRPMDEIYPAELLDRLADGVGRMRRWGIAQGEGALVGAANGELPVPRAVSAMTGGQLPPERAAREAHDDVTALQKSLR